MRAVHLGFAFAIVCVACGQTSGHGGGLSSTSNEVALAASPNSVAMCSTTPSIVASQVDSFAAGNGTLAMIEGTTVSVLRASDVTPTHFTMPVAARAFSGLDVDDQFVSYGILSKELGLQLGAYVTSVDYRHGTFTNLLQTEVVLGVVAASHHVFFESSGPDFNAPVPLTNASSDGTSSSVLTELAGGAGPMLRNHDSLAWLGDQNVLWTMPSDGSAAPTSHGVLAQMPRALGDGFVLGASSSSLVSITLDTHATTPLATLLTPNYPAQGAESPVGVANAAIGASNIYWSECWANGGSSSGSSSLTNWVLRSVPIGGGTPRVIDSFTWSAGSAVPGTCPQVAADGGAVYWTREGSLMRMCE